MRSGRSLLRQTLIPLVAACAATGVIAGPAFAQGPAPEPAPPGTSMPKPEPAPGATRGVTRAATTTRQAPTRRAPTVVRSVQPASPPPPAPVPPPAPAPVVQVAPSPSPPPAPVKQAPARVQKRETVKQKPAKRGKTLAAALPRLRTTAVTEAASTDNMLLIGGLALFVLVLGDTVFLALSARYLREI
jgi:hypothetical protein